MGNHEITPPQIIRGKIAELGSIAENGRSIGFQVLPEDVCLLDVSLQLSQLARTIYFGLIKAVRNHQTASKYSILVVRERHARTRCREFSGLCISVCHLDGLSCGRIRVLFVWLSKIMVRPIVFVAPPAF